MECNPEKRIRVISFMCVIYGDARGVYNIYTRTIRNRPAFSHSQQALTFSLKKRETEVYLDYYHIYTWTEGPLIIPPIGVNPQIFFFLVFGKIRGLFIYTDPLKRLNESSSNYYILFFFSESILPCWWSGTAEGISQLSSAIWKRRFLRHFPRFPSLSHFPALKIYIYICLYLTGFSPLF